jgi:hypothetical protein
MLDVLTFSPLAFSTVYGSKDLFCSRLDSPNELARFACRDSAAQKTALDSPDLFVLVAASLLPVDGGAAGLFLALLLFDGGQVSVMKLWRAPAICGRVTSSSTGSGR